MGLLPYRTDLLPFMRFMELSLELAASNANPVSPVKTEPRNEGVPSPFTVLVVKIGEGWERREIERDSNAPATWRAGGSK